jgi:hypothetical protein
MILFQVIYLLPAAAARFFGACSVASTFINYSE